MNEQEKEFMASLEGMKHQVSIGYNDFYSSYLKKERGEHVNDYEFLYRAKIWLSQLFLFFESGAGQKDFDKKVEKINDENVIYALEKTDNTFLTRLEKMRDSSFTKVIDQNENEKQVESFLDNKELFERAVEVSELLCA